ncbi:hypothetical protein [Novipirellula caenicola]|uniref:Glycosyltransferase RgtA/B/C/D-like domain-containing protein n=1 Tax=Novipirellula caenicola TaxID=1536901 RepID=A0ABP9VP46_9BACT
MSELRANIDSPCYPSYWRCFLCCFLLSAAILTVTGFRHYFVIPLFEDGDFAANSLQIADAMRLDEIYGNYSRWEFSHPGPAFFYVYAIGQLIFHYTLGICPEEHNAQLFTGMLLQTAFWSLAICVIYAHARRWKPILIIASLSFVHFQLCEQAFISIWPPHQLLMPFTCLLLSTASIVAGSRQWLWLFVLSACFCIHGHVAQPLFVLPLTAVAIAAVIYWQRQNRLSKTTTRWARVRDALWQRDVGVSVLITIPFLIPLFADWLKLRDSNLARILLHIRSHDEPDHSLEQSLNYYLQFYRYWDFHDAPESAELVDLLSSFPWIYSGWLAVMLLTLFGLGWAWKRRTASLRWLRWTSSLLLISILAQILTLKWGCMMDGEMFAFNAFINYALVFLNICLFTSVLRCFLNQTTQWIVAIACCVALLVVAAKPIHDDRWISDTGYRPMQGRDLDLQNGHVHLPVDSWIHFQSPHPADDWILMTGQANQWRKDQLNVVVPDNLSIFFGNERTIQYFLDREPPQRLTNIEVDSKPHLDSSQTFDGSFKQTSPVELNDGEYTLALETLATMHSGASVQTDPQAGPFVQMGGAPMVAVIPLRPTQQAITLKVELSPPTNDSFWLTLDVGETEAAHQVVKQRQTLNLSLQPEWVNQSISDYGSLVIRIKLSTQSTPATWLSKRATMGFRIHHFSLSTD